MELQSQRKQQESLDAIKEKSNKLHFCFLNEKKGETRTSAKAAETHKILVQ